MKVVLASDHAGYELKCILKAYLEEMGHETFDVGTHSTERCNYSEFGFMAAKKVQSGEYDRGVLICGTGVGISLSANKVKGIRCCVCSEPYSALLSRQHNNTNMLSMGARVVGQDLAKMILKNWMEGEFEGGRHQIRIDQIAEIEETGTIAALEK